MKRNFLNRFLLMLIIFVGFYQFLSGQTTVFFDDFNRANVSPGGTPEVTYNVVNTGTGTSLLESSLAVTTIPYLKIASGATAGRSYLTGPLSTFSSPFNATLSSNSGIVTWSINARHNRNTLLSGFDNTSWGYALILAASSSDLSTANGYAVISGGSGTNVYRLVKFSGGLFANANITNLVTGMTQTDRRDYMSIKVTYDPSTETWSYYDRTDGPSATPAWADPSTGSYTLRGTSADAAFTNITMLCFGFFWNHQTTASNNSYFDNFTVQVTDINPVWKNDYPKIDGVSLSGFNTKVNIHEPGKAYYVVLTSGVTAPTSLQVKAGTDASDIAALKSGSITCTNGNTEYSASVTGLNSNTTYDVYFVAEDNVPNLQATPVKVSVTTLKLDPPALTAASANNDVEHNFDITFTEDATWRSAITDVKIGGTSLNAADWDKTVAGTITLKPTIGNTLLTTSGSKTVAVVATGYNDAVVTQIINPGVPTTSNSTISNTPAMGLNVTSTVTVTAKDQYSNLVTGYIFKYDVTITNSNVTTSESYTIAGAATTTSASDVALTSTNGSGVVTFDITVPATVDGNDGVSVQVQMNNGSDNLGSAISYTAPLAPNSVATPSSISEHSLEASVINILYQNTTLVDNSVDKANFVLNNAPSGLTVASVAYVDATHLNLTLAYDDSNNDFDVNVTDLSIKTLAAELTSAADLSSNNITLTATVETAPVVTTNASISSNGVTTASWGGNVTADGGEAVTAKGICWGTALNPDISGSKTTEAGGTGTFISNLTGLTANTLYHVRAYSTNSAGTSYGSDYTFTTYKAEPDNHVTGLTAGTITATSLTLSFTGSTGTNLPDSYLILGKTGSGTYATVADGSPVADDAVWTDGNFAKSVTHAVGANALVISGLSAFTSYDFIVYPYSNSAAAIDYKTAATVPSVSATTLNSAKEILTFSFAGISSNVNINSSGAVITVGVPAGTNMTNLTAVFTLSSQASAAIGSTPQVSGVTVNNFTSTVVYTVTAGDATTKAWTVNVGIAGQPLFSDSFDYTVGALLSAQTSGGWSAYSTAGATEPVIASGNLSYPGLKPGGGNKVTFDGDGTDLIRTFATQPAGSKVYYSAIVKVTDMSAITSASGSHFAGLGAGSSSLGAGIYFKWDGVTGSNKFYIGSAVRSATASVPVYSSSTYDINTPILIVGCYEVISGTLNDKSYMWINPSSSTFGTVDPPASTLSPVASNFTGTQPADLSSVSTFYIRQDATTSTPFVELDELRVGLNWTDVTPKNDANDILTFTIPSQVGSSVINTDNHTVTVTMPSGTAVSALTPAITVSEGATIAPLTGVAQDFTSPVNYTVTSFAGPTQIWTITVNVESSTSTNIVAFSIPGQTKNAVISDANKTVEVTMPYGTVVTALVPTFTLPTGATATVGGINQVSGTTANDFTNPVTYKVKAQDGITTQDWTVNVVFAPNTAKEILTFSFAALNPAVTAVINASDFTVTASVPSGTDLTSLVATFTMSPQAAASIGTTSQVSGTTVNNYTAPVTYIISAGDGSTQNWIVTVNIAGEPLTYDPFDYTPGQLLSAQFANGWTTYSTAGATEVLVSEGNLSYPGLLPSKGNKITFDGAGTDVIKSFTAQSAPGTKVYFSIVLQVDSMKLIDSQNGTHFGGLSQATSTVGASMYFKWDGVAGSNKFYIGTAVRGATASTPVYTTTTYDINTPIFIIGCYELVDGLLNDKSYMWINPSADDFGTSNPPTPTLSAVGGATTDLVSVGYFYIRQDAANLTPFMAMDELRVGLSWSDVTPKAGVVTFNPENNATDVDVAVKPTITFVKPIQKLGGAAISDSDLASLVTFKTGSASGTDVSFTASIDQNKQVITISPASLLGFTGTYYMSIASVEDNTGATIAGKNSSFTTRAARNDSKLTDLKVDGTTITGFKSDSITYAIKLEYGTTVVPTLTYTLSDTKASGVVTSLASLPGTSTVVVTAEDGSTTTTYSVAFTVSATPSSDSKLKDLKVGNVSMPGFDPSTFEYTYLLPFGTVNPPVVTGVANSSVATVTATQAQSSTDMAFIEVKAQDGVTKSTYTIIFSMDAYIYKVGFETSSMPFPGWTQSNTIISTNFGSLPIANHATYPGNYAFRFIAGKPSNPPSLSGWLKTSMYPNSGNLSFWLYVQASDGNEKLLIHKRVKGSADSVLVAQLTSSQMVSTGWKEFNFDIDENDSTYVIFTSVLTQDATTTSGGTRIWIDDLALKGKINTGISDRYLKGPEVKVYPNPVHDMVTIDLNDADYELLDVLNSTGSKVVSMRITEPLFQMNLSNLKRGFYFLIFRSKGNVYTVKLLKM